MENYQNESGSINSVLNDFSTDMFDSITFVLRPVFGGIDHLRAMHQAHRFNKSVNKISNLDFEAREKILDAFSDFVVNRMDDENFIADLDKKISELDEVRDIYKELNIKFSNIDKKQQYHILDLSLRKLNGRIVSIRDQINSTMWAGGNNVAQLLALDQVFHLIQETLKSILDEPINEANVNYALTKLIFALLYIEAFKRDKISFDDFQDFLVDFSLFDYRRKKNFKDNDAVFEILTV